MTEPHSSLDTDILKGYLLPVIHTMNIQHQKLDERLYMKHYSGRKLNNTNERKIKVQHAFSTMNISHNAFFQIQSFSILFANGR